MRVTLGCLLSGCLAYGEILHSSGLVIYNRFPVLVQEERQTAFGVILVWLNTQPSIRSIFLSCP